MKKLIIPTVMTAILGYCFAALQIKFIIALPACGFLFSALAIAVLSLQSAEEEKKTFHRLTNLALSITTNQIPTPTNHEITKTINSQSKSHRRGRRLQRRVN